MGWRINCGLISGCSFDALNKISAQKKIAILRSIGNLSLLDYYKIQREKRSMIVRHGLDAMVVTTFNSNQVYI